MYSIGQLSKKTNISIRALRYYDEIGLLKPAKISESGYRYYSNEEINTLRHITALKELGFTLAAIKDLLSAEEHPKEQRLRVYLDFELKTIEAERKRLNEMEKLLQLAQYGLEMNGELQPEDIFLFIKAMQTPPSARSSFLPDNFTASEVEIIKQLPGLGDDQSQAMEWAKVIRMVKISLHEPPSSEISRRLAARIIELSMEWFKEDEQLISKYWSLIRPDKGEDAKVFGLSREVMDHIDCIVDWYLEHKHESEQEGKDHE
ncbi:MerR family transcriptional regulator [Paenibacillus donghaensis]|uniref:MerR family transcriptional regulator n=1 Tax=Paenibacillus donghaensis TaxID=414771 RepID=UPI0018841EFB|nr:MerR family transcriptional regulator [Paenibacillus donghaensis]MBE9914112.1 MerR family transcriptional regulator [Paenibacillus donghaensis]